MALRIHKGVMFGFPPIDAPTAAILGGITGFFADNVTGVVQRRLDRLSEERREMIQWYEETITLSRELRTFLSTYESSEKILSEWVNAYPDEDEVNEVVDSKPIKELLRDPIVFDRSDSDFLKGDITVGFNIEDELSDIDFPLDEIEGEFDVQLRSAVKDQLLQGFEEMRKERREEIMSYVGDDMGQYHEKFAQHLASRPEGIDEDVIGTTSMLMADCFVLALMGEIGQDMRSPILDKIEILLSFSNREIDDLEGSLIV